MRNIYCLLGNGVNGGGRRVRPGQHPILIMWPFSPVEFLFDVSQVEPASDHAPQLPAEWSNPFAMQHAKDAAFALHWR